MENPRKFRKIVHRRRRFEKKKKEEEEEVERFERFDYPPSLLRYESLRD